MRTKRFAKYNNQQSTTTSTMATTTASTKAPLLQKGNTINRQGKECQQHFHQEE